MTITAQNVVHHPVHAFQNKEELNGFQTLLTHAC